MKRIPIFKAGRHTPMTGAAIDFSDDVIRAAVAAYDPTLHEAPIVVGHPKDNHPAYGWVQSLEFDEATGEIVAIPQQVDPAFAEMVDAGRFKKRSASWYLPDSPNNPKPGTLYLRHVGFLGAQPPAVKGLKAVEFADSEEGVAEFGDMESRWAWGSLLSILRNWRESIIADKGIEAADKLVPQYALSDLEHASKAPVEVQPAAVPSFTEEDPMTLAELQAQVAALTAENTRLKANQLPANFAERETTLAAREAAVAASEGKIARAGVEARVDGLITAGKLLAAQKKATVDFAMSLADGEAVLDFGEGDAAKKVTQREAYLLQLESAGKVVEFGELSQQTGDAKIEPLADVQASLSSQVFGAKK